jgi:hypothetical protein
VIAAQVDLQPLKQAFEVGEKALGIDHVGRSVPAVTLQTEPRRRPGGRWRSRGRSIAPNWQRI